jgi:uncharacterized protein (DUF2062 family)
MIQMKRLIKKWMPTVHTLSEQPGMSWLKHFFQADYLWHPTLSRVAGGVAVGLFINFIPLPLQTVWAALLACFFRVNLPLTVMMTWINNPFTFIPINFMIYHVGATLLGESHEPVVMQLPMWEWHWEGMTAFVREFLTWVSSLTKPYLVGLPIVSIGAALIGYGLVHLLWRIAGYLKRRLGSIR